MYMFFIRAVSTLRLPMPRTHMIYTHQHTSYILFYFKYINIVHTSCSILNTSTWKCGHARTLLHVLPSHTQTHTNTNIHALKNTRTKTGEEEGKHMSQLHTCQSHTSITHINHTHHTHQSHTSTGECGDARTLPHVLQHIHQCLASPSPLLLSTPARSCVWRGVMCGVA